MSDETDDTDDWTESAPDLASWSLDRRRLLSAMGTAGAVALAGCGSDSSDGDGGDGGDTPTPTPAATPTDAPTQTPTATPTETMTTTPEATEKPDEQDGIHPRFGYTATSPDETPPVEPDHTVELLIQPVEGRPIPQFYFEPSGLAIDVGDTVKFNMATPHHNVNAYHPAFGYTQRLPDDVPPFSSPILGGGEYWLYTFEREGVHDIMCAPHEIFGMVGRIVVGSPSGPGASPIGEAPAPSPQSRPPEFTAGLVLGDDAMAPENVAEQGSVGWSAIADENKRLMLAPAEE